MMLPDQLEIFGHHLTEGDIIKLGRFKFKVRQLGTSQMAQPELRLDDANGACRGLLVRRGERSAMASKRP
eukprot:g28104.t1